MQAEKVTVTIIMESLSIQTLRGMLLNVIKNVEDEAESGELRFADDDLVSWETVREHVIF